MTEEKYGFKTEKYSYEFRKTLMDMAEQSLLKNIEVSILTTIIDHIYRNIKEQEDRELLIDLQNKEQERIAEMINNKSSVYSCTPNTKECINPDNIVLQRSDVLPQEPIYENLNNTYVDLPSIEEMSDDESCKSSFTFVQDPTVIELQSKLHELQLKHDKIVTELQSKLESLQRQYDEYKKVVEMNQNSLQNLKTKMDAIASCFKSL